MRSFFKNIFLKVAAVFIFAALIAPNNSAAADSLVLSITEAAGETGEEVTVEIAVDNAANTEGGQFVLNFDPEIVRPVAIEAEAFITDSASSLDMANLEYAPGQIMFMWVTAAADTADYGTLCTITFVILKEGESLVEIDEVVISPEGIDTDIEPGLVTAPGVGGDAVTDTNVAFNESSTSPLVIVAAVAVLAIVGYAAYRLIKKPGKEQA